MIESQKNDPETPLWPLWMRILSGAGAVGVIIVGFCVGIVPDFEIRHANSVGHGLRLTGITAVVVGFGVVLWGCVFLGYVLYPRAAIWKRTTKIGPPTSRDQEQSDSDSDLDH